MEEHSQKPKVKRRKETITLEEWEATGAHSCNDKKHSPITTQTIINPHHKVLFASGPFTKYNISSFQQQINDKPY